MVSGFSSNIGANLKLEFISGFAVFQYLGVGIFFVCLLWGFLFVFVFNFTHILCCFRVI